MLQSKVETTIVTVPHPVRSGEVGTPSAIRINVGAQGGIEVIVQHLIITQALQAKTELIVYRELRR